MHAPSTKPKNATVLARLRGLVPEHEIGYQHVLRIVERQADELLWLYGASNFSGPTPSEIVERFPRVKIVQAEPGQLTSSGASHWNGSQWVIFLRRTDPHVRQRFTMCHELAHVIHHTSLDQHFTGRRFLADQPDAANAKCQRERAADHFAGCLLMPKQRMLTTWANGVRDAEDIASHFDVSASAAQVRLEQLGLVRARWMCTRGLKATDSPPVRAFSATTETTIQTMRQLGLRQGPPSMRKRARAHTITTPNYALSPRRTM